MAIFLRALVDLRFTSYEQRCRLSDELCRLSIVLKPDSQLIPFVRISGDFGLAKTLKADDLASSVAVCMKWLLMDLHSRILYAPFEISCQADCHFPGHQGKVSGLSTSTDGGIFVSCGLDSTVRLCRVPGTTLLESDESYNGITLRR